MTSTAEGARRGHGGPARTAIRHPAAGVGLRPGVLAQARLSRRPPMSREALAEKVGRALFPYDVFARVAAGRERPSVQMVRKLCSILGCHPAGLLTGLPAGTAGASRKDALLQLKDLPDWNLDAAALDRMRAGRNWEPGDLADAVAAAWFSRDAIAKIENEVRRPKPETLAALCEVLDCDPEDLMPETARARAQARRTARYNAGMRAFADAQDPPVPYRDPGTGRIDYPPGLREAYARHLAAQDAAGQLAS